MLLIWLTCSSFRCFAKQIRVQSGSSGFSNERISDKLAVAHFRRSLFDDSEASFHWLLVLLVDLSLAFSSMATQLSVISQKLIQIKVLISVIVVQWLNSCWQSSSFLVLFLPESIQNLDSKTRIETDLKSIFPFLYKRLSALRFELFVLLLVNFNVTFSKFLCSLE